LINGHQEIANERHITPIDLERDKKTWSFKDSLRHSRPFARNRLAASPVDRANRGSDMASRADPRATRFSGHSWLFSGFAEAIERRPAGVRKSLAKYRHQRNARDASGDLQGDTPCTEHNPDPLLWRRRSRQWQSILPRRDKRQKRLCGPFGSISMLDRRVNR
jgi:hypothetical protein